jgi:hypothetical protein
LSFAPPCLAVVAEDEVGHWFIGSVDLHLDEPSFHAFALLTFKQAFVAVALLLHLLVVPVGSAVV